MRTRTIATRAAIAAALATISLSATSAQAKDFKVQIRAFVPISCEASLRGGLTEVAPGQYRIGRLDQFCNTGYQMSFAYLGGVRGAEFRVRDNIAPMMPGSTMVESFGRPINGASDVFLSNIDEQSAQSVASTLTVSVTPTGL